MDERLDQCMAIAGIVALLSVTLLGLSFSYYIVFKLPCSSLSSTQDED